MQDTTYICETKENVFSSLLMYVEYKPNINSNFTKMCGPIFTANGCSG